MPLIRPGCAWVGGAFKLLTPPKMSSQAYEQEEQLETKTSILLCLKYILICIAGLGVLAFSSYWYRNCSSPGGGEATDVATILPPPVTSNSQCDLYTFYRITGEPHPATSPPSDYRAPRHVSSALESNDFVSVKVIPASSIITPSCYSTRSQDAKHMIVYPCDPKFVPYRLVCHPSRPYHLGARQDHLELIRWEAKGANIFTIFNYVTREMRDYSFGTKDAKSFYLLPSLTAVIISGPRFVLTEVVLLRDGSRLTGATLLGAESYKADSEYLYRANADRTMNLFALVDEGMTSLGSIDMEAFQLEYGDCYVLPGRCAFVLRSPTAGSTHLTMDRYVYNLASHKFLPTTPVLIKAVSRENETLTRSTVAFWHLGTDKSTETFEFMLQFHTTINKKSRCATLPSVLVPLTGPNSISLPTPNLRDVVVHTRNLISYGQGLSVEIFRRKRLR